MNILILLYGEPGSGRRTVGQIAVNKFNCVGTIDIDQWCVGVLAGTFKIPADLFLDPSKPLTQPIIVNRSNLSQLMLRISEAGFPSTSRISTGMHRGRLIKTPQELLSWFMDEVVTKNCGAGFHVSATKKTIIDKWVTDSKETHKAFLVSGLSDRITLKERSELSPSIVIEMLVTKIEEDYNAEGSIGAVILNDGTIEDLEVRVELMLLEVREKVKSILTNKPLKANN